MSDTPKPTLIVLKGLEDPVLARIETLVRLFSEVCPETYPYWADLLYSKAVELQCLYEFCRDNDLGPDFGHDLTDDVDTSEN
jgi:hypothetical protein